MVAACTAIGSCSCSSAGRQPSTAMPSHNNQTVFRHADLPQPGARGNTPPDVSGCPAWISFVHAFHECLLGLSWVWSLPCFFRLTLWLAEVCRSGRFRIP